MLFRAAVEQWPLRECEKEIAKNEQCFLSCPHVGRQRPQSLCPPVLSVVPRCCAAATVVRERVDSERDRERAMLARENEPRSVRGELLCRTFASPHNSLSFYLTENKFLS